MLTSITTFLGVAPLVFERSVQAQFLIPMAAALGFGILFATGILMMLVPAFTAIELNILAWRGKHRGKLPRELAVTEPELAAAGD
jgi:hypothetical protein